jgi:hypothetical protein
MSLWLGEDMILKTKQRRRSPRWPVDWAGRYRLEQSPTWQPCRLIDISGTGVALEPLDLAVGEEPAGRLDLELLASEEEPLRFRGEIRHMTRLSGSRIRLGIEFAGLSALETNLISLLFRGDGAV